MHVLILVAQMKGRKVSAAHRLAEEARVSLLEDGNEVRVVDLANSGFDTSAGPEDFVSCPNPETSTYMSEFAKPNNLAPHIKEQVDNISWATHVLVCAPLWWMRLPGCFYNYVEKVHTASMFVPNSGLFKKNQWAGKKVMLVLTVGNIQENYAPGTGISSTEGLLFQTMFGSYTAVGFDIIRTLPVFGCMFMKDPSELDPILKKFHDEIKKIDSREIVPIKWNAQAYEHSPDDLEVAAKLPNLVL